MSNYNKPIQLLCVLVVVLFFINNQFVQRTTWSRGLRSPPLDSRIFQEKSEIERSTLPPIPKGFLSSKLASTARLANHIFELVSVYGMAKSLNRKPAIFVEDSKYNLLITGVRKVLPGLLDEFQIFEYPVHNKATKVPLSEKCCIFDNPDKFNNISSEYLHLTGHFYQSWKYFDKYKEKVQSFVKPAIDFSPLPNSDSSNFISRICIHIRRTDFVDGQHHSSNVSFIKPALEFIKEREQKDVNKKMLTVIMGDDPDFEAKMFEGTVRAKKEAKIEETTKYFVSENTPQDDLAYSHYSCDATLITAPSSTFGWWLGYLSKGQAVYYQDIRSTNDVNYKKGVLDPDDFFVPSWTSIMLDENKKVVVVT
ncbi:Putative glycosyltransferase C06E1.7 [Caenorhabditis elegans]|uniref:Putative glycosyltransferase C06E1.7 n=1 Tax=Caenorhabditis elegans TaxID=6239 RepID=YKQ7_CAEEL|nr:Putative glycosyltransferase C06E1.7 [Caenorhabditis elegans]P34302.2 RecName: Full=Putative glycosyltransferase C06E1.7 [Caenorhabditis elegans]CCD62567.1 Putative glycosyltransferase C06E1.7 [Caenorhabditis elegans]|eukprot:NP_498891.2 Putative glycosyltransferase C06E1.7 [Caenorhabditis elegans]